MMVTSSFGGRVGWASAIALCFGLCACGEGIGGGRASSSAGINTLGGAETGIGDSFDDDDDGDGTTVGGEAGDGADETAGDDGSDVFGDDDDELLFVSVEPSELVIELDLGQSTVQNYTVLGHYADGSTVDLTGEAAFFSNNPQVGIMNGTTLQVGSHASSFFDSTLVQVEAAGFSGAAQLTLAVYRKTGEQQDFFFVLPYEDPAGTQAKPLTFSTDVQSLDVFFNVDTTGSMTGPINNLQSSLVSIIADIQTQINDTYFGVASFEDYPISGYGDNPCSASGVADQPFNLLQEITNSVPNAQAAVNALSVGAGGAPVGCGADGAESNIEALYQIATGDGLVGPGATNVPANGAGIGGVAFRDGAMPVVVSITDAVSHDTQSNNCSQQYGGAVAGVAASKNDAMNALGGICARVVSVAVGNYSTSCGPLADGTEFAQTTGAMIPPEAWDLVVGGRPAGCGPGQCCTGINSAGVGTDGQGMCPLVYRANSAGSGLDNGVTDGVQMLAAYAPFDVTTAVDGVAQDADGFPTPAGVTTADLITAVTPVGHGVVPLPGAANPTLTATAFENVIPNTDVTFNIEAHNDVVPQESAPRLFEATVRVLASGCSDLDERTVFILVPPAALPPPG
ncbi:MAG: hypothetical protein AAF721_07535 [Myxococcota bacterium]